MPKLVNILSTFLFGCFAFIFLPLLAWGLNDINGFFSDLSRIFYVVIVLILNGIAAYRIPEFGKKKEAGKKKIKRQHVAVIILQLLSISLVLVCPFCDRRNIFTIYSSEVIRIAGLGFYTIGFIIMHVVEFYLGRQFSVEVAIQENHELLTDGPMKYVRHPRYLGMTIFTSGIALVFNSIVGLLLMFLTMLVLIWRISDEEKLMHEEFGIKWEEYRNRTSRLIPYIY